MFLQGYFYWFGVAMNVLIAFWFVFGVIVVVRNWTIEGKLRKKYAVKNLGGDNGETFTDAENGMCKVETCASPEEDICA